MKVVILCRGRGTRLAEETVYKPKPLVMVGDRPILWHIMKLYSFYGYNDFVLCLGYKGNMIKDYFMDKKNREENWNIIFTDTGIESGTENRLLQIRPHIQNENNFCLTYGDGVADVNIGALIAQHNSCSKMVTVTGVKPPNPFGVLEIDNGLVKTFAEKPKSSDWTNGGFFVMSSKTFDLLSIDPSAMLEFHILPKLAHAGEVALYAHNDFWHCIDTLKHLEGLNALYKKNERPWMVWEKS